MTDCAFKKQEPEICALERSGKERMLCATQPLTVATVSSASHNLFPLPLRRKACQSEDIIPERGAVTLMV